jgi:hypothetical protein
VEDGLEGAQELGKGSLAWHGNHKIESKSMW